MELWKRNLYIMWLGCFLCTAGANMIIPFLPLFVQELGVTDVNEAALWSAMIFGVNHLMIALFSPLWGRLSDTYGQKLMVIRSGLGMGLIVLMMGFVQTPLQLLILRAIFGTVAGFIPAANALIAIDTPKEHVGKAIGTLQTGAVSGQLLGPMIGGVLAATVGMRNAFFLTGIFLLLSTLLIIFFVKETKTYKKFNWFRRSADNESVRAEEAKLPKAQPRVSFIQLIKQSPLLLSLFVATYLVAFSMQSISPILVLYVKTFDIQNHIEIIGGLIFAASALGTMIAAPYFGRWGDKWSHTMILLYSVILLTVLNIPQALIQDPWVLMFVRFLTGICIGGMTPCVGALLRILSPPNIQGSVYGYNSSANSYGNVSGALFGGIVASYMGIPYVFYLTTVIFAVYCVLLLFQYKRMDNAQKQTDVPL